MNIFYFKPSPTLYGNILYHLVRLCLFTVFIYGFFTLRPVPLNKVILQFWRISSVILSSAPDVPLSLITCDFNKTFHIGVIKKPLLKVLREATIFYSLIQGSATCGQRAACGPSNLSMWPVT